MHLPNIHMSNGAWIFASAVAVAIIAPGVYAAATSVVAIGNPTGNFTAYVTQAHQLQTGLTAPNNVVQTAAAIPTGTCVIVYTPPAGKAIVVTQITYDLGTGTQGIGSSAVLENGGCNGAYDFADTSQAYEAQSHTFPTGLPMPSVAVRSTGTGNGQILVAISGYLIPATELPSAAPVPTLGRMRGMLPER